MPKKSKVSDEELEKHILEEGLSNAQIAELHGLTQSAITKRCNQIRNKPQTEPPIGEPIEDFEDLKIEDRLIKDRKRFVVVAISDSEASFRNMLNQIIVVSKKQFMKTKHQYRKVPFGDPKLVMPAPVKITSIANDNPKDRFPYKLHDIVMWCGKRFKIKDIDEKGFRMVSIKDPSQLIRLTYEEYEKMKEQFSKEQKSLYRNKKEKKQNSGNHSTKTTPIQESAEQMDYTDEEWGTDDDIILKNMKAEFDQITNDFIWIRSEIKNSLTSGKSISPLLSRKYNMILNMFGKKDHGLEPNMMGNESFSDNLFMLMAVDKEKKSIHTITEIVWDPDGTVTGTCDGIIGRVCFDKRYTIEDYQIIRPLGKPDLEGNPLNEGDIIESVLNGTRMVIKYGKYSAFCPVDETYMDSVGFYAEAKYCSPMPVGPTEEYARKLGNIYLNPELMEGTI